MVHRLIRHASWSVVVVCAFGLLTASHVSAAAFTNGSFEDPALAADGTASIGTLNDWDATGSGLLLQRGTDPLGFPIPNGQQFVRLGENDTFNSRIYQDFDTVIGQQYEVSYSMGVLDDLGGSQELTVSVFADGQLLSPLASQSHAVAAGSPFFVGIWSFPAPLQFTATTTSTWLEFRDTAGDPTANIGVDAVEVTVVPEPTSLALLLAAGAMGLRRGPRD